MSGVRVPGECGHECVRKYPGVGDGVLARIVPNGLWSLWLTCHCGAQACNRATGDEAPKRLCSKLLLIEIIPKINRIEAYKVDCLSHSGSADQFVIL